MQTQSRQRVLSMALELPPSATAVNRETVEAAVWQTLGWHCDPAFVGRLMLVIDAYADSKSRRAVAKWASSEQEVPASAAHMPLAQVTAIRRQLQTIARSASASTAAAAAVTRRRVAALPPLAIVSPITTTASPPAEQDDVAVELAAHDPVSADDSRDEFGFRADALFSCRGPCGRNLPRDAFWRDARRPHNVAYQCKECKSAQNKDYRQRKRQEINEMRRALNALAD